VGPPGHVGEAPPPPPAPAPELLAPVELELLALVELELLALVEEEAVLEELDAPPVPFAVPQPRQAP
jgi:hypothetical protein